MPFVGKGWWDYLQKISKNDPTMAFYHPTMLDYLYNISSESNNPMVGDSRGPTATATCTPCCISMGCHRNGPVKAAAGGSRVTVKG